jgi:hypothetical protein
MFKADCATQKIARPILFRCLRCQPPQIEKFTYNVVLRVTYVS